MITEIREQAFMEALYEGVLQGDDWRGAMVALADWLEAADAYVTIWTPDHSRIMRQESGGRLLSTDHLAAYRAHYHGLDPKLPILRSRRPGELFNDIDHFDEGFVSANPFYQEFSAPAGSRHTLDMVALDTPQLRVFLASNRTASQGFHDRDAVARFRLAADHVARVTRLKVRLDALEEQARLADAALDVLPLGIVVLDRAGRVATANVAARRDCARAAPLRLRSGRILAVEPAAEAGLSQLIATALGAERRAGGARWRGEDDRDWVVWVAPLGDASALVPGGAIILITDASKTLGVRREALMALYGLTGAEADLAVMLAQGSTLNEAAELRGVRVSTVRSQLLALLAKTGLRRQAELTALLARLPNLAPPVP